jgi:hypothetical protein
MSNPTELPDLAEAVRKLVKAKGRFHAEQNYKALADALAQYDARRAQPEGEAPLAVAQVYLDMSNWMDVAISELPTWERKGYTTRTLYPAATLSPLCGAQHAESGKEAKDAVAAILRDVCELDYQGGDWDAEEMLSVTVDDLKLICARHIAAQQSAAPGALAKSVPMCEGCDNAATLHADGTTGLCHECLADDHSAPGTPEAPAAAEKLYASWQHSQPDRYNIPPWRLLAESVKIEWEQRAAAQLDGDQEGSESHG